LFHIHEKASYIRLDWEAVLAGFAYEREVILASIHLKNAVGRRKRLPHIGSGPHCSGAGAFACQPETYCVMATFTAGLHTA
jgi:hypothetical protein